MQDVANEMQGLARGQSLRINTEQSKKDYYVRLPDSSFAIIFAINCS